MTRVLLLAAAALVVFTPAWRAARAIAAVCAASGDVGPASEGRLAPQPSADEEEEAPEAAALPRSELPIGRAAARRSARGVWSGSVRRRDVEHAAVVAARRWSSYRAPPRAPPLRLLN